MARVIIALASLVLALTISFQLGGCPPQDGDPNTNTGDPNTTTGDPNDTNTNGGNCGTRSVTKMPSAGWLQYVTTAVLDATPDDSGLAKVMFQAALCPESHNTTINWPLYEIDANGNVVSMATLFESGTTKTFFRVAVTGKKLALADGCLTESSTQTGDDDDDDGPVDPNLITNNPCGLMSAPVTRAGLTLTNVQGDYICIEVHTVSACVDCWYVDGVWHHKIVTTGYYIALGSLSGISVTGWAAVCDPDHQDATVSITTGDRVDFTWTYTFEYHESDSPESMGYQEIAFTP